MVRTKSILTINLVLLFVVPGLACRTHGSVPLSVDSRVGVESELVRKVLESAFEQTTQTKGYDPSYTKLSYPGGDVPIQTGVCSDVVIRAFRRAGVDLQKEVHEDMSRNFSQYPKKWGLRKPDSSIDHRRVPNLMTYFFRRGKSVQITNNRQNYLPGDVVAYDLGNGLTHIGLVSNVRSASGNRLQLIHNIGAGTRLEDVLFSWKIIGHYRYF